MPEQRAVQMPHHLILEDRRALTVSGVSDIDSFDDMSVVIFTDFGELTVKGEGLHINKLNIETGELTLSGQINSMEYSETQVKANGFFGRLFK